ARHQGKAEGQETETGRARRTGAGQWSARPHVATPRQPGRGCREEGRRPRQEKIGRRQSKTCEGEKDEVRLRFLNGRKIRCEFEAERSRSTCRVSAQTRFRAHCGAV